MCTTPMITVMLAALDIVINYWDTGDHSQDILSYGILDVAQPYQISAYIHIFI